jgi:hypothetical protein
MRRRLQTNENVSRATGQLVAPHGWEPGWACGHSPPAQTQPPLARGGATRQAALVDEFAGGTGQPLGRDELVDGAQEL